MPAPAVGEFRCSLRPVPERSQRSWEIKAKVFYYVITAADPQHSAADETIAGFRGFLRCLPGAREKDIAYGTGTWDLNDAYQHPASDQTSFDYEKIERLFDYFLEQGFTYFDTAYTYHGYQAEKAVKKALVDRYPRERFQLATKMPLRDFKDGEDLEKIFAEQLENCGVDYFDARVIIGLS